MKGCRKGSLAIGTFRHVANKGILGVCGIEASTIAAFHGSEKVRHGLQVFNEVYRTGCPDLPYVP